MRLLRAFFRIGILVEMQTILGFGKRLLVFCGESGVRLAAGYGFESVAEEGEDGGEAFFSTAETAGEVEDERCAAQAGDSAGEPGVGVALGAEGAHGLSQAGGFAIEDAAGGFRGDVAGAEAGSAYGEDQGWGFAGKFFQHGDDGVFVVGEDEGADFGFGPLLAEEGDRGGAGGVFHLALGAAVGDG